MAEALWVSPKQELICLRTFRSRAEAEWTIVAYVDVFYKRQRDHMDLDYQTSAEAAY
ncbi:MAG: IS3 family transposase [Ferrimicrobium sp.]|jgi:hypothetical protein|uniref:IS3 family transposase n=1 Tax=Ferrimicrobium acidiphilum TaxID=121039 RepID=A0ABV3Y7I4_9ACTN